MKRIYILDTVWPGWIDTHFVKTQLDQAEENEEIEVVINSPGGSVFEGIAIYNLLKEYKPTIRIIGLAGSIASVIAMAGAKIIMSRGAMYFVHEPWTWSAGDADYHKKVARNLTQITKSIIEVYQERLDKSEEEISAWLKEEQYLTGKESKEQGLADEIEAEQPVTQNLHKFAAMCNIKKFNEKIENNSNNSNSNSNGVKHMDSQEMQDQINSLTQEKSDLTNKISDLNNEKASLEKERDDFKSQNEKLEGELKDLNLKLLNQKRDQMRDEEEQFINKLVEEKKIKATQKDFLINDLVNKKMNKDDTEYKNQREFLEGLSVEALAGEQATTTKAGASSNPTISKSDMDDIENQENVVKDIQALADEKYDGDFEKAFNAAYSKADGGV